jgi:hypothetical protein
MADRTKFLSDIQSESADTRFAAWRAAGEQGSDVIPELAKIAASASPGMRKAALEAMTTLTHSVGKDAMNAKRADVSAALVGVATGSSYAPAVRAQALRLVSLIGSDDVIPPLMKLFGSAELREEAIYAVERIPGDAASKAIASAYASAADDFKPRILAALGHRRAAEGVPLAAAAMKSSNKEIASAGAKAYARIAKPSAVRIPAADWDSRLRFAEAQVVAGNYDDAMHHYNAALAAPEEHLQCAAIVGIAKMDTAVAAATIFPKLKSTNRKVRLTAEQAWKRMASTVPPKG